VTTKNIKEGEQHSRRAFLKRGAKWLAVLAGLISIPVIIRQIIPRKTSEGVRIRIGFPADYPINKYSFNAENSIYILRDHEGVRVLSARCTHLGCIIEKSDEGFLCPCHGSCYDNEGKVLSGAAPVDLPWLETYLGVDGRLVVEPGRYVSSDKKLLIS